jgi:hypothetical protein
MTVSPYIYGMHEPMPFDAMPRGWILHLVEVGHSGGPHPGIDLTGYADAGYGEIVRLQHAWGDGGTLPLPQNLDGYIERVKTCVQNSKYAHRWIIGNEPNLPVEWPGGWALQPDYVGHVYGRAWDVIHDVPGHEFDEVLLPPVGPWNIQIGIDWIEYFKQLISYAAIIDGFALHTYSRGSDPQSVTSEDKMSPPYQAYYNGFRTYRDWLAAIPERLRDLSVYVTETNQNAPWEDVNRGWVQEAYREIDNWNQGGGQIVRALCLYRWPAYDTYYIDGKSGVIADFQEAQARGYKWENEPPQPEPKRTLEVRAILRIDGQDSGTFEGVLEEI